MQTFLSEPTFEASAAVLDNKRLNKQLLEGRQILYAISITPDGGGSRVDGKVPFASNHPVTNQWRGYEAALYEYLYVISGECQKRGIKTEANWNVIRDLYAANWEKDYVVMPFWWTSLGERSKVLDSHRFNLWTKDPVHYSQYEEGALEFAQRLVRAPESVVCCASKVKSGAHAPYYYPTHKEI